MRAALTIVTPWRNHIELARDYWDAIRAAGNDVEVLVIDNGSSPPLPNGIRREHNSGFCEANNLGLRLASGRVLFLNNDIAATRRGWASELMEAIEPGVLVGAQLRHDQHGAVDGQRLPYLDGWCIGGFADDFLELGGWSTELHEPAYYSDNLLCLEARAAGMTLREVNTGLVHKLNGSTRTQDPWVVAATLHNRELFARRARELLATV